MSVLLLHAKEFGRLQITDFKRQWFDVFFTGTSGNAWTLTFPNLWAAPAHSCPSLGSTPHENCLPISRCGVGLLIGGHVITRTQ